jgi:hypothetical protein
MAEQNNGATGTDGVTFEAIESGRRGALSRPGFARFGDPAETANGWPQRGECGDVHN